MLKSFGIQPIDRRSIAAGDEGNHLWRRAILLCAIAAGLVCCTATKSAAQTGREAWLRYERIKDEDVVKRYATLPPVVVALGDSEVIQAASQELTRGVRGMMGRTLRAESQLPQENAIVLGTFAELQQAMPSIGGLPDLNPDGYWIKSTKVNGATHLVITAPDERGVLYGTFALLRSMMLHDKIADLNVQDGPFAPLRMLIQTDRFEGPSDGSPAGRSIFWEDGRVADDLSPVQDFARLLASVGINGCSINAVLGEANLPGSRQWPQFARVADVLRPYGIQLYIVFDVGSLPAAGRSRRFDADRRAVQYWKELADEMYREIPDLGGVVLEGQARESGGPSGYGRSHADVANAAAAALEPHGGVVCYRLQQAEVSPQAGSAANDPARVPYDRLQPLDGQFAANVVILTGHRPLGSAVREPVSPLLAALPQTNQAIELSWADGQLDPRRLICFFVPRWEEVLNFDLHLDGNEVLVKNVIAGKTDARPIGGFVGRSYVGLDQQWLGGHLNASNLYGFGRLAWDPDLSTQDIAEQWARLTFGHDPKVVGVVVDVLLHCWSVCESYTLPLGLDVFDGILSGSGEPPPAAIVLEGDSPSQNSGDGIGTDRTVGTGSGFVGQYPQDIANLYESVETCPDELLLFFHRVPFTQELQSGKTVVQHMIDAHYNGAKEATRYVDAWKSLQGRIETARYEQILNHLLGQADYAQVWRDAFCQWIVSRSGVADQKERVGKHPSRHEAEEMNLGGYRAFEVLPPSAASGGQAIEAVNEGQRASASFVFEGEPGWYDISVRYFDESDGASDFALFVGDQPIDQWHADEQFPAKVPDGRSSTRRVATGVALRSGDEIRLEAVPAEWERACVDYVELHRRAN